jgi:hypothetical protein
LTEGAALVLSQAFFPVDDDYAILRPFADSSRGASIDAAGLGAVEAGQGGIGDGGVGVEASLQLHHPPPVGRLCPQAILVPILAGDGAGIAPGTACLIEIETLLHPNPP